VDGVLSGDEYGQGFIECWASQLPEMVPVDGVNLGRVESPFLRVDPLQLRDVCVSMVWTKARIGRK